MLHINSIPQEVMKNIVNIYNLPVRGPREITSPLKLAEYVFDKCFHLIPHEIKEYYNITQKKSFIKMDLLMQMIINAYMVQLMETQGNIKRSGALFTRVFNFYTVSIANGKPISNLFGDKNVPRAAQEHFNKLSEYWMLPLSDNNASYTIPAFSSPLIAFQTVYADAHKVMKDYSDSQHSFNYLRQHKDTGRKLHLHVYDNFKFLLDQFHAIDKIARLFDNDQLSYHPTLNRILFEREYHLGLASKISVMTKYYPDEIKIQCHRLLSVAAMLPNINGRLFYLTSLLTGNISASLIQENVKKEEVLVLDSLATDEHLPKIKKISRALIGMALITIPVMEVYFLYLWQKGVCTFNDANMKEAMEEYAKINFIDERVQPLSILLDNEVEFKLEATIGGRLQGEWELAELPFNQIREILKFVNEVADTQRHSLRDIFLDPYHYLKENGYDKLRLMLLEDGQIQEMIKAVGDVVEENHLQNSFKN